MFDRYTGIGIWKYDLSKWEPGNYTVKISYDGNEEKCCLAKSTSSVIHHSK